MAKVLKVLKVLEPPSRISLPVIRLGEGERDSHRDSQIDWRSRPARMPDPSFKSGYPCPGCRLRDRGGDSSIFS